MQYTSRNVLIARRPPFTRMRAMSDSETRARVSHGLWMAATDRDIKLIALVSSPRCTQLANHRTKRKRASALRGGHTQRHSPSAVAAANTRAAAVNDVALTKDVALAVYTHARRTASVPATTSVMLALQSRVQRKGE